MTIRHMSTVVLGVLVVLLAGCGQKTTKTEPPASESPTASAQPAPQPPVQEQRSPVELTRTARAEAERVEFVVHLSDVLSVGAAERPRAL